MKILVIGFQRSGTTLLRRLIQAHPDVCRIFHEFFLLKKYSNKKDLYNYLKSVRIFPEKDIWGEKVPYYPSVRRISVMKYCQLWDKYFGDDGRIIHVVRHPIDVAHSVVNMYNQKFMTPIKVYKKVVPIVTPKLFKTPRVYTVKYEELLLNHEETIPKLFDFCNLDPNVDIWKYLAKSKKKRYRKIDKSRAFAHRIRSDTGPMKNLKTTIDILNKIPGPEYDI